MYQFTPSPNRTFTLRAKIAFGLFAIWAGLTTYAFGHFWRIDATPGKQRVAPNLGERRIDRQTVILFLHPECPCSRATVAELARVAIKVGRPTAFQVYFVSYRPDHSWRESNLYELVIRLPGVEVALDPQGRIAQQYGADTSGQIIAYDRNGSVLFQGGITGSRGHEGENAGKARLLAALTSKSSSKLTAPVYGCRLFGTADNASAEVSN